MPDFELLIATEEEAQAGGDAVPLKLLPPVEPSQSWKAAPDSERIPFYDQVVLCELWASLSGKELDDSLFEAFELVYQGSDDGPWIYRLPQEFVDRLGALSAEQVEQAAGSWSQSEEFKFAVPEPPKPPFAGITRLFRPGRQPDGSEIAEERRKVARTNLEALVELVQRAKQSGKRVYLYCEL